MTATLDCMLFTYYFWNEGYPSAHHLMDRLPLAASSGIRFRVISSMAAVRQAAFEQVRVPPVLPGDLRFVLRMRAKNSSRKRLAGVLWKVAFFPLLPLFFIERLIPIRDFTWSWCLPASLCGILWSGTTRPDVLYSFGGRYSAHLAAAIVSKVRKIPWVAQLQDPLIHGYAARTGFEKRFLRWVERTIMWNADTVVFMTDTARRVAEARSGAEGKGLVNYPGFDPRWFEGCEYQKGETFEILHVGSFGWSRSPETFLEALKDVALRRPEFAAKCRFGILGNFGAETEPFLRRFPRPEMIRTMDFVPRAEAYRRMCTSDVLLLVQNREDISAETIPSKFYEYLYARRPILGLLFRNPELRDMLERRGCEAVELDDVGGIARSIESLFDRWQGGGLLLRTSSDLPTVKGSAEILAYTIRAAALDRGRKGPTAGASSGA